MARTMTSGRSWTDWPGWDYVPGIAFIAIGAFALTQPNTTSIATSILLGSMLCVAGAFALAGGLVNLGHRGGWLVALLGALSLFIGAVVIYYPIQGAISLVWAIGAWLIVGAAFEFAIAFSVTSGRGWLLLVGIVDLALGIFITMMPAMQAYAFLGYYVGISLIFRGLWSVVFVSDLHEAQKTLATAMA
jgi:uncharacterized membrane protein HdeD (DUF308 family)